MGQLMRCWTGPTCCSTDGCIGLGCAHLSVSSPAWNRTCAHQQMSTNDKDQLGMLLEKSVVASPVPANSDCVQSWIDEMATHLKQEDPNHLVTVGEEGFWAVGSAYEASNPGNGWAAITGQNFTANHASKAIDFAGIHVWPDNWEVGCKHRPLLRQPLVPSSCIMNCRRH